MDVQEGLVVEVIETTAMEAITETVPVVDTIVERSVECVTDVTLPTVVVEEIVVATVEHLIDSSPSIESILSVESETVAETAQLTEVVVDYTGRQGPPGPAQEEEQMYSKRVDFVSDTLLYRGEAEPGASDTAPLWRIRRTTFGAVDGDVDERWAGGDALFDKIWADRLTLTYT